MKKIILALLFVTAVIVGIRMTSSEDVWLCDKATGQWIRHGNPSSPVPTEQCGETPTFSEKQKADIENYIKENISALSPTKEVLGGKFYVTGISWQDAGTMKVDYEDGHIAVTALAKPFFDENGQIKFEYFNSSQGN